MAKERYCVRLEEDDMNFLQDYLPPRTRNKWLAEWVAYGVEKLRQKEAASMAQKGVTDDE